jgi:DNA-binding transcriptional LysR family regulator
MIDPRRMLVLREVARSGSVSGAASTLSYTPSAITQQIRTLEHEAGMTLLERAGRGVRLTDAGRRLALHADALAARLADAEDDLLMLASGSIGFLRVETFPSAGAALMPTAITAFKTAHPAVELHVTEAEPEESLPRLRAREVDLVVSFHFGASDWQVDADLEATELLTDPLYLVLPAAHRLASNQHIRIGDLSNDDWVQGPRRRSCSTALAALCDRAGFRPKIAYESDDYETVQALVAGGVGVALVPRLALRNDTRLCVRELDDGPVRRIAAVQNAGTYRGPLAMQMVDALRAAAGNQQISLTQP